MSVLSPLRYFVGIDAIIQSRVGNFETFEKSSGNGEKSVSVTLQYTQLGTSELRDFRIFVPLLSTYILWFGRQ